MSVGQFVHTEELSGKPVSQQEVEIVERKGIGHPDTLIDGACESVSLALCDYYEGQFGKILHHNVDKGLLVGGQSHPRFGGGVIVRPIYILVAGRAIREYRLGGRLHRVPVEDIAREAIRGFIQRTIRNLDVDRHVCIHFKIRNPSSDLSYLSEKGIANDTSIGVGFAPLSETEKITLGIENYLNSAEMKKSFPEIGEDIKVMSMRKKRDLDVTVAMATVDKYVPDRDHYISVVQEVRNKLLDRFSAGSPLNVSIKINNADDYKNNSFYLTVTGTSAESGDDGNTGRGNRVTGLITPMRMYSMEATAGKNPTIHTGKVYNALAQVTAERVAREVKGVQEVYVRLLSRIGASISEPTIASVALRMEKGFLFGDAKAEVENIMASELSNVRNITSIIRERRLLLF
ncbi:MAG: methionine adenosyltransferase [Nitrososphaeria archaeon]